MATTSIDIERIVREVLADEDLPDERRNGLREPHAHQEIAGVDLDNRC